MFLMQNPADLASRMGYAFALSGNTSDRENNPYAYRRDVLHEPAGAFIRDQCGEARKRGFRRVLIHRPYGEKTWDDKMDFDARATIMADYSEWSSVAEEIEVAMLEEAARGDLELIVYLGAPVMLEPEDLVSRLVDSLGPLLEAPVSLAIDATAALNSDRRSEEPYVRAVQMLRAIKQARGFNVYIESFPPRLWLGSEWTLDVPAIGIAPAWVNQLRLDERRENKQNVTAIEQRMGGPGGETILWYEQAQNHPGAWRSGRDEERIADFWTPLRAAASCLLRENMTLFIGRTDWLYPNDETNYDALTADQLTDQAARIIASALTDELRRERRLDVAFAKVRAKIERG